MSYDPKTIAENMEEYGPQDEPPVVPGYDYGNEVGDADVAAVAAPDAAEYEAAEGPDHLEITADGLKALLMQAYEYGKNGGSGDSGVVDDEYSDDEGGDDEGGDGEGGDVPAAFGGGSDDSDSDSDSDDGADDNGFSAVDSDDDDDDDLEEGKNSKSTIKENFGEED